MARLNSHEQTVSGRNNFIHNFGFGRAYPTVQERSEIQNVDSSQSRLKQNQLGERYSYTENYYNDLCEVYNL